MAADHLGHDPLGLEDLRAELERSWPPAPAQVGLVELAGGVRSPIAHDGDCAQLTGLLDPELVLLVADAGLGTISAVRSSLDSLALEQVAADRVGVHLNRYDHHDELHRRNLEWLRREEVASITTTVEELVQLVRDGCS